MSAVTTTRLGERTCVLSVSAALDAGAAGRLEADVDTAMADGCRDFVLDFTAVRGCADHRPAETLARIAHRLSGEDCEAVVAACHVDLLTWFDAVPDWSRLPLALARNEALALLLERPVGS
jgi:hypothetical protein